MVVCFDLGDLEEGLRNVGACICVDLVWGLALRDPRPRVLLLDECSLFQGVGSSGRLVTDIVKRARKQRLGVIGATADVGTFLSDPGGAGWPRAHLGHTLLQNSAVKEVLGPVEGEGQGVMEALGLSGEDLEFVNGGVAGRGVVVEWTGDVRRVRVAGG